MVAVDRVIVGIEVADCLHLRPDLVVLAAVDLRQLTHAGLFANARNRLVDRGGLGLVQGCP